MSLRVVGYLDGRPQYDDEGPGHARVSGYGGRMVAEIATPRPSRPRHDLGLSVCGQEMANGGICIGKAGHHDHHRSVL